MDARVAFRRSIYQEHRDEAAALYDLRTRYLDDVTVPLDFLAEVDQRLEAHLDGIVLGGVEARAVCAEAGAGEPGLVNLAARGLIRSQQREPFLELIETVDLGDPALRRGLADALEWELLDGWASTADAALSPVGPAGKAVWARVAGVRRLPVAPRLVAILERHPEVRADALWALGQLGDPSALPVVRAHIASPDPAVAQAAGIAALRLRMPDATSRLAAGLGASPALALPFALAAGEHGWSHLAALDDAVVEGDTVLALALTGDTRAVPALLTFLEVPRVAPAAAMALALLTGAGPLDDIEVPRPAAMSDDDEDTAVPLSADADLEAPGMVVELSRDPARWEALLAAHRWASGARYQLGEPASPEATLRALSCAALPRRLRGLLADELAIRYGIESSYFPELPGDRQLAIIAAARAGLEPGRFQPGHWYRDGGLTT